MHNASVEKGSSASPERSERPLIAVAQPKKLEGLLDTINLLNTVSERIGDKASENWSGGATGQQASAAQGQTWRDEAIANLPATPAMQRELRTHIEKEIATLQKEVHAIARRAAKPGAGYKLTKLYARIRRLNGILQELLESSVDVVKRLYIRIFVDKQSAF
jgi:hypothetical protein